MTEMKRTLCQIAPQKFIHRGAPSPMGTPRKKGHDRFDQGLFYYFLNPMARVSRLKQTSD
jgi:hypothetical protein